MVIYVLNARLECLTNFTIFRFRWFNNWFPYFWINWLGYGLTLGYLLFISIFFWIFPFCSFRPQKVHEKRRKARKTRPHWANGQENLKISTHQAGEFRFTPAPPIHFRSCRTFHTLSRHFRSLSPRSLWAPPPFMSCRVTFTMSASNWDTNSPRLKRASRRETRQLICFCIVFSPGNSCGPQKRSFDLAFCRVGLFRQSYVSHSPTIPSAGHLGYAGLVYTYFLIHLA